MNMIGTKELKTERMILRKLRENDAEDLFNICGLGESIEETKQTVSMMLQYVDEPMSYHWVFEYEGRVVGRLNAWEVNPLDDY